jgi:hypothetical protein
MSEKKKKTKKKSAVTVTEGSTQYRPHTQRVVTSTET